MMLLACSFWSFLAVGGVPTAVRELGEVEAAVVIPLEELDREVTDGILTTKSNPLELMAAHERMFLKALSLWY